ELAKGDLAEFVRDHKEQQELFSDDGAAVGSDADKLRDLVRVAWEIPDTPVSVWFDRHMLRRVMANLVRNAAQAIRDQEGREGPGHVQVSLRTWEKDWVSLEVEDDGPGIPANIRESLFDPYVTTKQDGTGLGLAIVKKIVVEHGGTIEVSDTPLGGARFSIRLPRSGTAASAAAREPMSTLSQAIPSRFDLSRPNTRAQ
ncbi:MAG TPA: ATP-binding protein, partial [Polyangiaceae bacterium]|nr:ATP-binding protein [Polyangiaceae bacterium]